MHNDENSIVKQQFYKSLELFYTGHLPVASLYTIELKSQDSAKLRHLKEQLINS